MAHVVLAFSNSEFGESYPQGDRSAHLFERAFLDWFPDSFVEELSCVVEDADYEAVEKALRQVRGSWQAMDDDWLIVAICSHGIERRGQLFFLDDRLSLGTLDELLADLEFRNVAILLDCCTRNAPRRLEYYEYRRYASRIYADMVDAQGQAGVSSQSESGSAFSRCVHYACRQLSESPLKVTIEGVLHRTDDAARNIIVQFSKTGFYLYRVGFHRTECLLNEPDTLFELTYDGLVQTVRATTQLLDYMLNPHSPYSPSFDKLVELPQKGRFMIMRLLIEQVFEERVVDSSEVHVGVLGLTEYLVNEGLPELDLGASCRSDLFLVLWDLESFRPYLYLFFLLRGTMSLDDVSGLMDLLRSRGERDAELKVAFEIVSENDMGSASHIDGLSRLRDLHERASKVYEWLFDTALTSALRLAGLSIFDAEYEMGIQQWARWWRERSEYADQREVDEFLTKAEGGSGPDLLIKVETMLKDWNCTLPVDQRFQYVVRLVGALAEGRHWGAAILCFEWLLDPHFWRELGERRHSSRSGKTLHGYPESIGEMYPDVREYLQGKHLALGRLMKKASAPTRWRLLLLLARYRRRYSVDRLAHSHRKRGMRYNLIRNLNRLISELKDEIADSPADLAFGDDVLLEAAVTYVDLLRGRGEYESPGYEIWDWQYRPSALVDIHESGHLLYFATELGAW